MTIESPELPKTRTEQSHLNIEGISPELVEFAQKYYELLDMIKRADENLKSLKKAFEDNPSDETSLHYGTARQEVERASVAMEEYWRSDPKLKEGMIEKVMSNNEVWGRLRGPKFEDPIEKDLKDYTNRYLELFDASKEADEEVESLTKVHEKDPSEENLRTLQEARRQARQVFDEVVDHLHSDRELQEQMNNRLLSKIKYSRGLRF